MSENKYEKAAEKYKPEKIKILFIAESPPISGAYFYFEKLQGGDSLFRNIMKVIFPSGYKEFEFNRKKVPLLMKFRENGYFLIDVCNFPINKMNNRNKIILENSDKLIKRVKSVVDGETRIILIKKNVYEILGKVLLRNGFNMVNSEFLDFPGSGNQKRFREKLKTYLDFEVGKC